MSLSLSQVRRMKVKGRDTKKGEWAFKENRNLEVNQ
jgi:hypothetical protein